MAKQQFLDTAGLETLISLVKQYTEENKAVTFNYLFEVDNDGNLVIEYPDNEPAPTGFSIDANGYLVYEE